MTVADSSVLIGLASIGEIDLLIRRFPDGLIVPPAVWREVVESAPSAADARLFTSREWISVLNVNDKEFVSMLRSDLDEGEAEAIALARERLSEVLLLDEKDARKVARSLGLRVLGTVGILIWAKRTSLIRSLREKLDALVGEGRFHLSTDVYEEALRVVGESD